MLKVMMFKRTMTTLQQRVQSSNKYFKKEFNDSMMSLLVCPK